MPTSDARINANRINAQKSTGPKTVEGKAASRQNSLKHGLSGSGVVVAESDQREIDRRVEALEADLQPQSLAGQVLIGTMATLSVKMERSARQESAAIAKNVRHAIDDFDEARIDEAEDLFDTLSEDPRRNLRKLRKSPEGIDRLVEAWGELRDDLTTNARPLWTETHLITAAHLLGRRLEEARGTRFNALSQAIWGDFSLLGNHEGGLDTTARKSWAVSRLVEQIDAEIAALETHRASLDFDRIELDRLEAPDRALFDTSKAATLARRYESEARRSFFKSLKEFRLVEAEAASKAVTQTPPNPHPAPSATTTRADSLASIREMATAPARESFSTRCDSDLMMDEVARTVDGRPLTIGRAVLAAV